LKSLSWKHLERLFVPMSFTAVAYLFLGANIFAGGIVAPMDLLLHFPGWQESGMSLPLFNMERSDVVDATLPKWIFIREQIAKGELPLWDPLRSGGEPGLFVIPNACVSIGFLLFLLFGDGVGFTLALLARLVIAGLGTYVLCRTRLKPIPSMFGGITYMMCGFNSSWLMWPQVETSAWMPWVLWAVIRLEDKPCSRRMTVLALLVAALIFGGFPAVAGYGLYAVAILAAWLLILKASQERDFVDTIKRGLWISGGVAIGFALTSIQLFPFIEYVNQFDISWRHAGGISIYNIALLFDPFLTGQPRVEKTGYMGLIPLTLASLAVLVALRKSRWRSGPLSPLLWAWLASLTLVAIYQTPHFLAHLLYLLPVLNNNSSGRMLVLLGLEIALLGAVGLQVIADNIHRFHISSRRSSQAKLVTLILLMLIGLHAIDISRVGRAQNAVVPIETFFPDTPAISYIQEHIRPGQSVLTTGEAFLIPGTLCAYGLPEWFAHSYHTLQEKAILNQLVENPFKTPTAARFYFNQINTSSALIDALAIRYILTSRPAYVSQEDNDLPAPPTPPNILGQEIHLSEPAEIIGLELLMATYGRSTAECDVRLTWFDETGCPLAESTVKGHVIKDNSWTRFKFDEPLNLTSGKYRFQLDVVEPKAPPVTVWTLVGKDGFQDGFMTVNGQPERGDLAFRLLGFSEKILDKWTMVTPGDYIIILERENSPPGAYFLQENASFDEPDSQSWSWENVRLLKHDANSQTFLVETNSSGWLVRAARNWPGWRAYVNGKSAEIRSYLSVLTAVHIDAGRSIVDWRYEPMSLKVGAVISSLTIAILLIIFVNDSLRTHREICIREIRGKTENAKEQQKTRNIVCQCD